MKKTLLLAGLIIVLSCVMTNAQNKLYVDINATGNNDGSNWTNALTSLQLGLIIADTSQLVDSVLVAEGVYHPEYGMDRHKMFYVIQGGFSLVGGYDPSTGLRDFTAYPTIISGEIGDTTVISDNSYVLMSVIGDAIDSVRDFQIDGFTFTKGNNNNTQNFSMYNSAPGFASRGGALWISESNLEIHNCIFDNNRSVSHGGAIYLNNSTILIDNSVFTNNFSGAGGALLLESSETLQIRNSVFENNESQYGGAAIFSSLFIPNHSNTLIIERTLFNNNKGQDIVAAYSELFSIYSSDFYENETTTSVVNVLGANQYDLGNNKFFSNNYGTSLIHSDTSYGVLQNNLIANNIGDSVGSTIFSFNNSPVFTNNTVVNNDADYFMDISAMINVNNTVLYGNDFTQLFSNLALIEISNSYIEGSSDTVNGNINALLHLPGFKIYDTAYANADFELGFGSVLLDNGDTVGFPSLANTTDLNNQTRIIGSHIDIGAYEKQSANAARGIMNNASLSSPASNGVPLMEVVTAEDWTYYATMINSDSIVFAIKWGANNAAAKVNAQVYVTEDAGFTLAESGNDAMATLGRFWNVDLGTDTLAENVTVRFFYSAADSIAVADALTTLGRNNITTKWFMTATTFDPATQVSATAINNGNIETYTVANGTINGLQYVELSGVSGLVGGTMMFASDKPNSIKNNVLAQVKIVPNPATTQIALQNINAAYLNKPATIVDVYGRVLHTIQLKENMVIDVQSYTPGMYFINVEGSGAARFIKK